MVRTMPIARDRHRCFWRMVVARLIVFVVFLALVAPLSAAASGGSTALASPAITSTTSDLGDPASGTDDPALVQHAHCPFHQNAAGPNAFSPAVVSALVRGAFPACADTPARSRPAALPFKPPRA